MGNIIAQKRQGPSQSLSLAGHARMVRFTRQSSPDSHCSYNFLTNVQHPTDNFCLSPTYHGWSPGALESERGRRLPPLHRRKLVRVSVLFPAGAVGAPGAISRSINGLRSLGNPTLSHAGARRLIHTKFSAKWGPGGRLNTCRRAFLKLLSNTCFEPGENPVPDSLHFQRIFS